MAKSDLCCFCGVKVYLSTQEGRWGDYKSLPDNTATIEHMKTKHDRKKGEVVEKVLCCLKCNRERGIKVNRKVQLSNVLFSKAK